MSGPPQKIRKKRSKRPRSNPVSTSSISQPTVEDLWSASSLSAFSPDAQLFAFLSSAVDKHRLRVFDTNTNLAIAEHAVDGARVTSLAWITYDTVDSAAEENDTLPSKKRKRFNVASGDATGAVSSAVGMQTLALGLSNGSIQIFSAVHGRILRTLEHDTCKSSVLAIAEDGSYGGVDQTIWSSTSGGILCLWHLHKAEILLSMPNEGRAPYSALAIRPGLERDQVQILAADSTVKLLSSSNDSASSVDSDFDRLNVVCTFGGHASSVKSVLWDPSSSPSTRFYSCAEDDRFVYMWQMPDAMSNRGKLAASCPLDADVRQLDLSSSPGMQILLALSSSGKITLSPIPVELSTSVGSEVTAKEHVPTLLPRSTVNLSRKAMSDIRIASVTFLPKETGRIRAALISGGAKIVFETLQFLDDTGEFISDLVLKPSPSTFGPIKDVGGVPIINKRYTEPSNIAVATGAEIPHDPKLDVMGDRDVEGALDADLAELSLGERLAVRSDVAGGVGAVPERRSSDNDVEGGQASGLTKREQRQLMRASVPAHSLTRTLIQALHADDTSLLEACLAHSDESLVRNTIARLPSQLAVPLLTTCVERLGRGTRGTNIKGRGGGASAQRGMALMKWVRAVLIIHSGYLMMMPDLVARLSHLHSTLTTRLMLQERLLSLSGRLELVLAQVELRSSNVPAPFGSQRQKNKRRGKAKSEPLKYVEGESSDEDEEGEDMHIEIEKDDDGSVEDIELGVESSEEDIGDEDEADEANLVNGFVDDEAEEDYDEDESEEDSD